uniref:Variant surface glycoprotein 789 n=1 Tax=Trypanosoma brucei TaxID=5691 RepID=M4SXS5_9TRYP|nr:variant surface glycoprotein 789 [Trypanosoma brucei]
MIASLIIALLFAAAVDATAPDAGSNSGDFAVLCEVISLARAGPAKIETPTAEDGILKAAALINLTLNSPETLDLLVKAENKDTAVKDTASALGKACTYIGHDICLKAADRHATHKDSNLYRLWFKLRTSQHTTSLVRHLTTEIKTTHALLVQKLAEASTDLAGADLKAALGPEPDGKTELKLSGDTKTRAQLCGEHAANTKGTIAGKSLATDAICLCGIDGTQATDKVCSYALAVTGTPLTNGQTDVKDQWKTIAEACDSQKTGNPTTSATIRAALTAFRQQIAIGKGADHKLTNILGLVDGDGRAGCAGEKDSNKGTCVFYGASKADHNLASIQWATKMNDAANKLETAQKAAAEAFRLHTKLITLNDSVTAAVFAPDPQAQSQLKPDATTKTTETNKKECEAITKAENCKSNGKCKWTKDTEETGKHCQLNDTHVAEKTTKAGTGTGKGAAGGPAASGCARHGNDKTACEADKTGDKQNCAWRKGKDNEPDQDKEMCRNGSFLSNKNFALSMAAAFVGFSILKFMKFMKLSKICCAEIF